MKKYDGPSIFNKKERQAKNPRPENKKSFNFLSDGLKSTSKTDHPSQALNFNDDYQLPKNLKSKNERISEFKQTLDEKPKEKPKQELENKPDQFKYTNLTGFKVREVPSTQKTKTKFTQKNPSTFRVREVPSPMLGYTKEQKARMRGEKLKTKETLLNFPKLKVQLKKKPEDFLILEGFEGPELEQKWSEKLNPELSKNRTGKRYGLNRKLSGIIEEDYNELKSKKRNVSGLFSNYYDKENTNQ